MTFDILFWWRLFTPTLWHVGVSLRKEILVLMSKTQDFLSHMLRSKHSLLDLPLNLFWNFSPWVSSLWNVCSKMYKSIFTKLYWMDLYVLNFLLMNQVIAIIYIMLDTIQIVSKQQNNDKCCKQNSAVKSFVQFGNTLLEGVCLNMTPS